MKKKILVIAAAAICFAILGVGTAAYFTAERTASNVITTGKIAITVLEQQCVDGDLVPYPADGIAIMPATTISKIVSVRSDEETAYVRMKYTVAVYDARGNEMQLSSDPLDDVVVISPANTNWIEKDGWWYYNAPLAAGEVSEPLFEEVVFSGPGMGNAYQNCTLIIKIHAQAVQTANNPASDGDVTAVRGWPIA